MLIHAVWEDGRLNLPEYIKPKHNRIKVVVDFPESELEMVAPDIRPDVRPEPGTDRKKPALAGEKLSKKIERLEAARHWSGPWKGEKSDRDLLYEGLKMRNTESDV